MCRIGIIFIYLYLFSYLLIYLFIIQKLAGDKRENWNDKFCNVSISITLLLSKSFSG